MADIELMHSIRKGQLSAEKGKEHSFAEQLYAFGSRVIGYAAARLRVKPHSDLDLVIVGEPLPLEQLFTLRDAFSQSDLPMRVDIVQAGDLPEGWRIRAWPL